MTPQAKRRAAGLGPHLLALAAAFLFVVVPARALAQGKGGKAKPAPAEKKAGKSKVDEILSGKGKKSAGKKKGGKAEVFDFTGLSFTGEVRTPQLLYFLDRAASELEQASLERRSFVPEMVRSIDEEAL